MKKYDFYIIGLVLAVSLAFYTFGMRGGGGRGMTAEIYVDGMLYKSAALSEDEQTIEINSESGQNVLMVYADGIKMISADCPTQTCVHTPKQSISGGVIACLPNKVIVRLSGEHDSEVDVIAN